MFATGILLLVLGAASPAVPTTETLRWTQVRSGLTREQITEILGEPLMRNAARGYERWVYDAGCEVQFTRGAVSAWTAPKPATPTAIPAAIAPVSRREMTLAAARRT